MDNDDQIMHPVDAELLSSEEEFDPQPSTSFSTIPTNSFLNSCRHNDFFLQQQQSQIPQSTIELALHYLTLQLAGIDNSQLISNSEYPEATITSLPLQSLSIANHLVPELLNSLAWDQWLALLATLLTPIQWQFYWMNYLTLFGTIGLPQHIVNFLTTAITSNFSSPDLLSSLQSNTNWMLFQQQFYGMYFLFSFTSFSFFHLIFFREFILNFVLLRERKES